MIPLPLFYANYRLDTVYGRIAPQLAAEIISLWQENRVVGGGEASRRVAEVVMTIRDGNNTLVGVNTVYIQDLLQADNPYYFYRVFIRPRDRKSFGLRNYLGKTTREFLKGYTPQGNPPHGVVIVVENRKLSRPGARKMLARQGWNELGKGPRGFEVWYINFDGSRIPHRQPTTVD